MSARVTPNNELKDWLHQFMRTDSNKKDLPVTHTWLVQKKDHRGKPMNRGTVTYHVPQDHYLEMYDLIEKMAFQSSPPQPVHLVERFQNPSTLKVDIDFSFEHDTTSRVYNEQILKDIIQVYHKTIQRYLDIPNEKLLAYVFERTKGYHDDGKYKDGLHLMYPEIVLDVPHQKFIRQKVLDSCCSIFDRLNLKNSSYDDVIDESIIDRNGWMMYGSRKTGKKPYLLTHIYDMYLEDQFDSAQPPNNRNLIEYLSLYNVKDKVQFEIKPELKQLLTPAPQQQLQQRKTRLQRMKNGKVRLSRGSRRGRSGSPEDIEMAKKLVKLLDLCRYEEFHLWIQVGLCLHNIDDSLLETWIEFSKQWPQFKPGECEDRWQSFKEDTGDPLGMGSLHHWARLDDPIGYETIKRGSLGRLIELSMNASTTAVARVVHEMYKYQYVCISLKYNTWYEFRNHRWHEIDKGVYLQQKLSNEVLNEYLALNHIYLDSSIKLEDEGKEPYIQKAKKLLEVTLKLQDIQFKEKVMKECAYMFYNSEFHARLDGKGHLLGFENGVYNLYTQEFRDGRPEDYISLSTNIEFHEYGDDEPVVQQIRDFMSKVFPSEALRHYVWTLLASFLEGKNKDEKFHIWNGCGSNGKSKTLELLCLALGDYTASLPISLLTQKRAASNAASPELARCRGARFVYMQEPDRGQRMNIGYMKELTGGDKLLVRPLYKEPFEFKPMFKMILCCNDLPKVPPDDEGTWRRIRVIEFISKFTRIPDPEEPHQYPIDLNLAERFDEWKEAFMYLLTQKFQLYQTQGGLDDEACPEVKAATNEYQRQADIYKDFINDCIVRDSEGYVCLGELYQKFRDWWHTNGSGKCPDRISIKKNLEKKMKSSLKPYGRTGYRGIRMLTDIERNQSEDEEVIPRDDPALTASLKEGQKIKNGRKITVVKKKKHGQSDQSSQDESGTNSSDETEMESDLISQTDELSDDSVNRRPKCQRDKPLSPSSFKKAKAVFGSDQQLQIRQQSDHWPIDKPKPALKLGLGRKTVRLKK